MIVVFMLTLSLAQHNEETLALRWALEVLFIIIIKVAHNSAYPKYQQTQSDVQFFLKVTDENADTIV